MKKAQENILYVQPRLGAPMAIRIASPDHRFVLERIQTRAGNSPVVEFYDYSFAHEPGFTAFGQFICSYDPGTLLEPGNGESDGSLVLKSRVPQWAVDAKTMIQVRRWLQDTLAAPSA